MKKTLKNQKMQQATTTSRRNEPKRLLPLMIALGAMPMAHAATINVGGGCSLVDAITAANTDSATGGCSAGSGADTIELESSTTYTLTAVNNTTDGENGLPSISSEIIINGNGATISREEAAPKFRILHVAETTGDLTLNEVTIRKGYLNSDSKGGGILNYGTVTLNNSIVSNNHGFWSNSGGGIFNYGTMTLNNCTVEGNSAEAIAAYGVIGFGGGIWNSGTMMLMDSTVSGNSVVAAGAYGVGGSGGGIWNSGTMILMNSTVSGNSAYGHEHDYYEWDFGSGGGITNSGTLTLMNSTVSGNSSNKMGGGIDSVGSLTLINSTVSGNAAHGVSSYFDSNSQGLIFINNGSGGGISGSATLINSTVVGNSTDPDGGGGISGGTLTLTNTIIANNTNRDCSGTLDPSSTNNLIEDGTCSSTFPPGTDPNLGPLQDNDGPTQTHALLPDSPAIDAGTNNGCPDTDQRGITRPINGTCDIGAYEYQGIPPTSICSH
jgi:hypothetical protein